jgi:hypothetical protein
MTFKPAWQSQRRSLPKRTPMIGCCRYHSRNTAAWCLPAQMGRAWPSGGFFSNICSIARTSGIKVIRTTRTLISFCAHRAAGQP